MKILLLGANGQLGSDIVLEAQRRSLELEAWRRNDLDITDLGALRDKLKAASFDVLINCTSYHKTDEVEDNAAKAVLINAHAVKAMAESCHDRGALLMHFSTDYVFGGNIADKPLSEDAPPAPLNVYGATKLLGESLARAVHDRVCILRVASLFGVAGASGKGGNFVETMIRLAKEKGHLRVVADQVMSPTYTRDIAQWTLSLLQAPHPEGIFHAVNSGGSVSWFEFARQIITACNLHATVEPIKSAEFPTGAMRPRYSALNNNRLALQLAPPRTWRDALQEYVRVKGHVRV